MSNYKVEAGFDFYAALNTNLECTSTNAQKLCLLSSLPLDHTAVTLPCKHSFNYAPLYRELVQQKKHSSSLETVKLGTNEFKCPYCRTVHPQLIPFVEFKGVSHIRGVNTKSGNCMNVFPCDWTIRSGKHKNECCGKRSVTVTSSERRCSRHRDKTSSIKTLCHNTCMAVLKSGKRKGEICGLRVKPSGNAKNSVYCGIHKSKN